MFIASVFRGTAILPLFLHVIIQDLAYARPSSRSLVPIETAR